MTSFRGGYRGRRVLITGVTGFKGSWLATWLDALGAKVSGFANGVPTSPANFDLIRGSEWIDYHEGDVRDLDRLSAVIDDVRPDLVFHLAAQALVREAYAFPIETFQTNTMGTINVLECLRHRPWIGAGVIITSDKAYRNDEVCWGYRETDALGGHDPYSGSKACAELAAFSYHHSFFRDGPTAVATTRAGNVIGGGDWAADRIVPDSVRAWSRSESVVIRSPHATRPWQHVLEPLSGYLHLGERLLSQPGGLRGEAFNFGPDASVVRTVGELLTAMAVLWPQASWQLAQDVSSTAREATLLKLSCDKALHDLKWRAVLSFPETVEFTVEWYRSWLGGSTDMLNLGLRQIARYTELADLRGLGWASV